MAETPEQQAAREADEYRRGICPNMGESFRVCKSERLCDCTDYPEFDHYKPSEGAPL